MGKKDYILRGKAIKAVTGWETDPTDEELKLALMDIPAADVAEVVRCGECKYQDKGENDCEAWNLCGYRPWLHIPTEDDAFCSKGERKDG